MTQTIVVWAWQHHGDQHVQSFVFDSEDVALRVGLALRNLQDVYLYSTARVFRTPDLEELTLTLASTSFAEIRPGPAHVLDVEPLKSQTIEKGWGLREGKAPSPETER